MKILLIGNSYTYYNDMPKAYLEPLARAAGIDAEIDAVTCGGWTLEKFADHRTEYGAKIRNLLAEKRYDVIVLQEQSVRPAAEHGYAAFFDAARKLFKTLSENTSRIVLYETWAHEAGSATLASYHWTHTDMTWRLAAAYQAIAEELGLEVAHVGRAFFEICRTHPAIDLFAHDHRSHPSPTGSYLAALVLLARITGVDPTAIPFDGDLPADVAAALKQEAHAQALAPTPIPPQYRISSEGISGL